jgi:hypothetical protein
MAKKILTLLSGLGLALAQATKADFSNMAPLDQYLMGDRNAEIALARSAAPDSISRDAGVLVFGRKGYETAAGSKNGFTCLVQRSWAARTGDPEFWNPKLRSPACFNAAGVRTFIPLVLLKTKLVLAGKSKIEISRALEAAWKNKELPEPDPSAMCYMLSKQQYTSEADKHWHPHLMFFVPLTPPATWGANLRDSPVLGFENAEDHMTVFLIPVRQWSDGSLDHEAMKNAQDKGAGNSIAARSAVGHVDRGNAGTVHTFDSERRASVAPAGTGLQ